MGRYELYFYRIIGLMFSYSVSYITRPKRIFRTLKIKLYKLHRVSFGGVGLKGLKESEFRLLDENEINQLKIEISSN